MKKIYVTLVSAVALLCPLSVMAGATNIGDECKAKLTKDFPRTVVSEVKESPVSGVCEVVAGNNVLLYSPQGYLFVGSLYDTKGVDLVQTKKDEVTKRAFEKIPFEYAIKSGSGPVQVVEFTDVDCPYCVSLKKEIEKDPELKKQMTLNTFLFPLDQLHPRSAQKSRWVFCQKDEGQAVVDIMLGGKFKDDTGFIEFPDDCKINTVEKRLYASREAGQTVGVQGTPTVFVEGARIQGKPEDIVAAIKKAYDLKSNPAASKVTQKTNLP